MRGEDMPTKSLDDYRAMIAAWTKAHPYEGDVSQYYGANDLVSGGVSEAQMAATNQPQDEWNEYKIGGLL